MSALNELSIGELTRRLASREVSSVEATRACLARISQVDDKVKAFLRVDPEGALAAARAADDRRGKGQPASALDGVPIAIKDIFCTADLPTTAGSKMLEGFRSPYDATVVERLRAAGLPMLGKLNMDEFAMGSSNENSAFFPTHNPYDLSRTPGGSSGGSAAAVAAREAFGTLGTDTGGSIRLPAALTNVVGLKPTWGRVSRHGVVAFASSLDQVGPLARTVSDTAALLQVIAGEDRHDSTCARVKVPDYRQPLEAGAAGFKLGVPREYFAAGLDPEVEAAVRAAVKEYERLGAKVVELSLPHTRYALATYYLIASAEASSNLGRYDGVRFGHRTAEASGLRAMYEKSRSEGFGPEVKRRILLGTYALAAGYYDAYYLKAQKVRTLVRREFEEALGQVDALISPTSPVPAFKLGEKSDPLSMYLMDVLTIPASLAGLPALSLPCGFTRAGLPIGLQLIGRPFAEATVLQLGRAFERGHEFAATAPGLA
jgi:aspartyl-tRNA(Asn)/glutamyl-tRNA(Gln) amidotransferase subunit A